MKNNYVVIIKMSFNPILATFSFLMFVAGVMFAIQFASVQEITKYCSNKKILYSINFLLILFVVMATVPIMQLFCHWGCGCPQKNLPYTWIVIIICVLIISCSSTLLIGFREKSDDLSCEEYKIAHGYLCKETAIYSIIFSVILLIILLILKIWGNYKRNTGAKVVPK